MFKKYFIFFIINLLFFNKNKYICLVIIKNQTIWKLKLVLS